MPVVSKELKIRNSQGLHARPATLLVRVASSFKSSISIEYNDKAANAKSLIGILSLGINKDSTVNIVIKGSDEEKALENICELINNLE
nr:HPr family phosphocarrier protein [Clostridium senegalense]